MSYCSDDDDGENDDYPGGDVLPWFGVSGCQRTETTLHFGFLLQREGGGQSVFTEGNRLGLVVVVRLLRSFPPKVRRSGDTMCLL